MSRKPDYVPNRQQIRAGCRRALKARETRRKSPDAYEPPPKSGIREYWIEYNHMDEIVIELLPR